MRPGFVMNNKKEEICPLCSGTEYIGNRITGYRPCNRCLDTDRFKLKLKELGPADCIHCMGTGKSGDYITGFIPCTRCKGTGKVNPAKES